MVAKTREQGPLTAGCRQPLAGLPYSRPTTIGRAMLPRHAISVSPLLTLLCSFFQYLLDRIYYL